MATRHWVIIAIIAGLAAVPATGDRYFIYLASEILIFILFAMSVNILLGYAGQITFGHAAFFAIGAYACAIFLTTLELPFAVAFLGAILSSALAAVVVGYFCVKLTAIYFAMLTLAFAQLVWAIAFKWDDVTGGDTGFIGVAVPAFLGNPTRFFYFALFVVAFSLLLLWVIVNSAYGRTLIALRENPLRAEFIGVNVKRMYHTAFVLAGTFAGIAGALFTLFNHSVFAESAWWTQSAEVLIMAILGGIHSFFGPAIGATALIILNRIVTEVTVYWPSILAVILLAVLFLFPQGLVGVFQRFAFIRHARGQSNAPDRRSE